VATISTTGPSAFEHSEVDRLLPRRVLLVDAHGVAGFVTKPLDSVALVTLASGVIERTGVG